jgi:hypothetical protein
MTRLDNGGFQFGFTNASGVLFRVVASTDVALPLSSWSFIGYPAEITSAQYRFTDMEAANYPQRFYRVLTGPVP